MEALEHGAWVAGSGGLFFLAMKFLLSYTLSEIRKIPEKIDTIGKNVFELKTKFESFHEKLDNLEEQTKGHSARILSLELKKNAPKIRYTADHQ